MCQLDPITSWSLRRLVMTCVTLCWCVTRCRLGMFERGVGCLKWVSEVASIMQILHTLALNKVMMSEREINKETRKQNRMNHSVISQCCFGCNCIRDYLNSFLLVYQTQRKISLHGVCGELGLVVLFSHVFCSRSPARNPPRSVEPTRGDHDFYLLIVDFRCTRASDVSVILTFTLLFLGVLCCESRIATQHIVVETSQTRRS
jgi:hypothetical protein